MRADEGIIRTAGWRGAYCWGRFDTGDRDKGKVRFEPGAGQEIKFNCLSNVTLGLHFQPHAVCIVEETVREGIGPVYRGDGAGVAERRGCVGRMLTGNRRTDNGGACRRIRDLAVDRPPA